MDTVEGMQKANQPSRCRRNQRGKKKKEEKKRNKGATKGELTSINKWYELTATAASFDFAGLQEYL